jgi:hypothetical protein
MNVKNRKCIRKLSLKSLYANRRRNLIAIFAIALTTLLIHNHHFKWWFVLALIRAILLLAQKGGIASFVTGPL